NNKATSTSGGGLYLLGTATIKNTTITANSTTGNTFGGGLLVSQLNSSSPPGSAALTDSTVSNNTAVFGAGIALSAGCAVSMSSDGSAPSTVSGNKATD